ncbi:MAG TPA: PrsW family intramembrane metalloprotease [Pyrinomonadaceae bacterium]|nr:PrsW family intramembrane metalloprotease [Pyrinomonadaceae bacterium]
MYNQPPSNYYQQPFPPPAPVRSRHRRAIKWVVGIIFLLVASLLGLLTLFLVGAELTNMSSTQGPVAFLLGLILATLPVPIYVLLILWIDRYEAEPLWLLGVAFIWGAVFATFSALILNTISIVVFNEAFGAVISAPIVEESAKAFALFTLYFWKKDEFDGIVDGIVYAGMVALGFAMTENISYYGRGALAGRLGGIFIVRGLMSPFSHPLFTSMTGIGLGWSRQTNNGFVKFAAPVMGFGLAILLHATWNGSITFFGGLGFLITYFVVMVPIFVAAIVVIFFALRREGRVVREQLLCDYQRGFLTPEEYQCLCSVPGRMGSSFRAFRGGGFQLWRDRMQWNQLASELAFHRSRVARGIYSNEQETREREAAYLQLLHSLSQRLRQIQP